ASPRPGFDHWVSVPGQGKYLDPELNVDGRRVEARGYVTDLFNDQAVRTLARRASEGNRPFCLFVAHKCVHPDLEQRADVFTSDHGYFYGEHRLSVERRLDYEEAIRIPLLIRYPPLIKPGTTFNQMVLSIDLAPTLLELGGAAAQKNMHGRSLAPLPRGDA